MTIENKFSSYHESFLSTIDTVAYKLTVIGIE